MMANACHNGGNVGIISIVGIECVLGGDTLDNVAYNLGNGFLGSVV